MKKAFAVFLACLLVGIGVAIYAVTSLHNDRAAVEVTPDVLSGDLAAAEGFTAAYQAHYQSRLSWDLTIPLDHPEETEAVFSSSRNDITHPEAPHDLQILMWGDHIQYNVSDQDLLTVLNAPLAPYQAIFEEIAAMTDPGEVNTDLIRLSDYMDTLPLYPIWVSPGGYGPDQYDAGTATLADYFTFPIHRNAQWNFTVTKDNQGVISELGMNSGNYGKIHLMDVMDGRTAYLAFGPYNAPTLDFSLVPGGYGIYRMEVTDPEADPASCLVEDSLTTVYPLPETTVVFDLNLSPDGRELYVLCWDEEYFLHILDTETWTCQQTLTVPEPPPERAVSYTTQNDGTVESYPIYDWTFSSGFYDHASIITENAILLLSRDNILLFTREQPEGPYVYQFTAPEIPGFRTDDDQPTSILWNGDDLALAFFNREEQDPLALRFCLYDADGTLALDATYTPSLNHADVNQPTPDETSTFVPVQPLNFTPPALTWNP